MPSSFFKMTNQKAGPFSFPLAIVFIQTEPWTALQKVNLTDNVTAGQWYKILQQLSPASLVNIPGALTLYTCILWFLYMRSKRRLSYFHQIKITVKSSQFFSMINTLNHHHNKVCFIETFPISIQIHNDTPKISLRVSLVSDGLKEDRGLQ